VTLKEVSVVRAFARGSDGQRPGSPGLRNYIRPPPHVNMALPALYKKAELTRPGERARRTKATLNKTHRGCLLFLSPLGVRTGERTGEFLLSAPRAPPVHKPFAPTLSPRGVLGLKACPRLWVSVPCWGCHCLAKSTVRTALRLTTSFGREEHWTLQGLVNASW
jgi:hypothetical protein